MSKQINICSNFTLVESLRMAEYVHTDSGNDYYKIPFWMQKINDVLILHEEMPEDLKIFVTKAGLGGDNPQIKKAEL